MIEHFPHPRFDVTSAGSAAAEPACCSTAEQSTCCDASEKATCCAGPTDGCGCQ